MGCARTNNKRSSPVPSRFLQDRRSEVAKTQTLSFPIRLPDILQAEALRLLDASRIAINQIISDLWPQLDLINGDAAGIQEDRKSTRLHSSHTVISYAVFCLK